MNQQTRPTNGDPPGDQLRRGLDEEAPEAPNAAGSSGDHYSEVDSEETGTAGNNIWKRLEAALGIGSSLSGIGGFLITLYKIMSFQCCTGADAAASYSETKVRSLVWAGSLIAGTVGVLIPVAVYTAVGTSCDATLPSPYPSLFPSTGTPGSPPSSYPSLFPSKEPPPLISETSPFPSEGPSISPPTTFPQPENDSCRMAQNITVGDSATWTTTVSGTTHGATPDADFASHEGQCKVNGVRLTAPGVWYHLISPKGALFTIEITTCSETTNFNTQLSIFDGLSCLDLTCVGANDQDPRMDGCVVIDSSYFSSSPPFPFVVIPARDEYRILVHGYEDAVGDFNLTIKTSFVR